MEAICFGIIVLSFVPFGRAIYDIVKKWKEKKRGIKLISVLAWFFVSLFMVRFAEVLYLSFVSDPGQLPQGVSGVVASVSQGGIHALQSFSMDESYGEMLGAGLSIVQAFLPGQFAVFFFTLYFAIQNIVAPLAGGAILLDILTGVSADLQIQWRQHKEKHVFSCATSESIALAETIPGMNKNKVAIFTDFAIDSDDDADNVLKERMEMNDFIYTDDHMAALKISAAKSPLYFYLMDEDEESNVNQLLELWKWREILLGGCNKQDAPLITVYYFMEGEKASRLVASLMKQSAEDPRFVIRLVDSDLNLIANLATKEPLASRIDALVKMQDSHDRKVVFLSDNAPFTTRFVSSFNLYCENAAGENQKHPEIILVSAVDTASLEQQFKSDALYLPKNRRETIMPARILDWDGTDAGLYEMARFEDGIKDCTFIVVAEDSDLQNMQLASVLDDALEEAGLPESQKPIIACFIRNDAIADQFKEMFGAHVVPFGSDSEMNSYEVACKAVL